MGVGRWNPLVKGPIDGLGTVGYRITRTRGTVGAFTQHSYLNVGTLLATCNGIWTNVACHGVGTGSRNITRASSIIDHPVRVRRHSVLVSAKVYPMILYPSQTKAR